MVLVLFVFAASAVFASAMYGSATAVLAIAVFYSAICSANCATVEFAGDVGEESSAAIGIYISYSIGASRSSNLSLCRAMPSRGQNLPSHHQL